MNFKMLTIFSKDLTRKIKRNPLFLFSGIVFLFLALLSYKVIKNPFIPLIGFGDVEHWEYTGFYVQQNFHFFPIPHIDLVNNQVGYPYETNNVFRPWGLERDFFFASLHSLFGSFGWIQIYYLISLSITSIGAFILLRSEYGIIRSGIAGLTITFFNFYSIHKYPHHLSISVLHWTALGIILDFLIFKNFLFNTVSLKRVILRIFLTALAFGQELGYIAGYSLTSFLLLCISIVVVFTFRYFYDRFNFIKIIQLYKRLWRIEFYKDRKYISILLILTLIIGYIYVPIILQILNSAKSFSFDGVPNGLWWTNAGRIIIPYLPFFNPQKPLMQFHEVREDLGEGSVGWFILILAILGLLQSKKLIFSYVPLFLMLGLVMSFSDADSPLKLLPWFSLYRVGGRATAIYSTIFTLFSLGFNLPSTRHSYSRNFLLFLLILLACTELNVGYSFKEIYKPHQNNTEFLDYAEYLKSQPEEAVLDWPFCVMGGNGQGGYQGLCPYPHSLDSTYALQRFHEKKVISMSFGRLHPSQVQNYLDAGWDRMLLLNSNTTQLQQQKRCFNNQELSFFESFYQSHDFAGINLYTDFLPQDCVEQFFEKFGNPIYQVLTPSTNLNLAYIPKNRKLKQKVNAKNPIIYKPYVDLKNFDLAKILNPQGVKYYGLDYSINEEISRNKVKTFRLGIGNRTKIDFSMPSLQTLQLDVRVCSLVDNQSIAVKINNELKDTIRELPQSGCQNRLYEFQGYQENEIIISYTKWNKIDKNIDPYPYDDRHLAVKYKRLNVVKVSR
jgi:hypothetical protein